MQRNAASKFKISSFAIRIKHSFLEESEDVILSGSSLSSQSPDPLNLDIPVMSILENVNFTTMESDSFLPEMPELPVMLELPVMSVMPELPLNNRRNVRVTPSLFEIGVLEEGSDGEEDFDYIGSLVNSEALNEMYEYRRAEAERKSLLLEHYYAGITNEQIEAEVRRQWLTCGKSRSRISKNDRNSALASLRKKVVERDEIELADEFLVRFGATQTY